MPLSLLGDSGIVLLRLDIDPHPRAEQLPMADRLVYPTIRYITDTIMPIPNIISEKEALAWNMRQASLDKLRRLASNCL